MPNLVRQATDQPDNKGGGTNKLVLQANEPHLVRLFILFVLLICTFPPEKKTEPAAGAAKISDAISLKKILYF